MKGKPKKSHREKDLTSRFASGRLDEDLVDPMQRFSRRSKHLQADKTLRTAIMRAEERADEAEPASLLMGQVTRIYSLFCEVEQEGGAVWRCVFRRTLLKTTKGDIIVGDRVRFRELGLKDETGRPEGVIEQVLPRQTVLARSDSFKGVEVHPIVANAEQVLIVASLHRPEVKWGLIDRMLVAAESGRLAPIVCLNKIDLAAEPAGVEAWNFAQQALAHYEGLGVKTLRTSVPGQIGIEQLRGVLRGRTTVLAGHSGVGKSSLIRAVQPDLEIRIGQISGYTDKGRHTTSSARRYALDMGGQVVDTPGVKLFGLWDISRENLAEFFPDVAAGTAPSWREESYRRIEQSLG